MKILLTGAAGFIGSHVAEALVARGDTVVGFDNFNDFYDPALKRRNVAELAKSPRFSMVLADLEERESVFRAFAAARPELVIHLAARAGVRPSIAQPALYERTNGLGTLHVLEAARDGGNVPVALASSSSVYGGSTRMPYREDDPVSGPISPYAATKRANELQAHTFHAVHRLPVTCLRYFTVYGPRQRPEMAIAKFIAGIAAGREIPFHGDGSSRRDYTFIEDIVRGTVAAADRCAAVRDFRIVNLGGSGTTTLAELVALIEGAVGRKAIL